MRMVFVLLGLGALVSVCCGEAIPAQAWRNLSERFGDVREDFARSEDDARGKENEKGRSEALAYLRSLLLYESSARILIGAKDVPKNLEGFREFSSQERRTIGELRQEIREEERARIVTALSEDTDLVGEEKTAAIILKLEFQLDSFFQKNIRKQESEIKKLEKLLGRDHGVRREIVRKQIKTEIAALDSQISAIHDAVYGFAIGVGFREGVAEVPDDRRGELLAEIVKERERVLGALKDEKEENKDSEGKAGTVGGAYVYSSNLGVVLDVSGSMTKHLAELKGEINSYFEAPKYREVNGCRLDSGHLEYLRSERDEGTWATLRVMEELITVEEVDTVYWFSDLQDDQSASSIRRLRELLMRGGVRFYVKSLGKKPSRTLDKIVTDFQG